MAIETILNSILNEPYMKNMRQSIVDGIEQVYEDATFDGNTDMEVLRARGSESTLNDRLNKSDLIQNDITLQLPEKATKSYVDSKFGTLGNTFTFKGSCLFSALPTTGASSGDYWYVTDKATNYAYNGSSWTDVGNSVSVELENIEGIDNMKNGFIKRFLPQNHWLKDGWSGTAIANVTNRTSVRENQTIDSTFDLINTNESLYEVRAYKYNNETNVLENTFLAPAYDLPAGNYKFDLRNPDSTINFYNMTQDNRTTIANGIVLINVGKIRIPYLEKEIDDIKMKKIDKPFVILDFDWYTYMHQERYEIVKKEYGFNASFCLDEQTTDYNMNDYLPRDKYNNLIENGWDVALYGGTPDELITDNSSYEYWYSRIKNLVDQKKTIGIFNPYTYNVPSNQNTLNIRKAVKDNGFKLMRATTDGNFIKSPNEFELGAVFMTTNAVSSIKTKIDTCIANTYGICLYTHKVLPDSGNINDGQDAAGGHIYETSFRQILDYIKPLVDSGQLEVLTAREYFSKYNPEEAIEFDENRNVKMQNFILSKVTM